jgi:hypothetical protein
VSGESGDRGRKEGKEEERPASLIGRQNLNPTTLSGPALVQQGREEERISIFFLFLPFLPLLRTRRPVPALLSNSNFAKN